MHPDAHLWHAKRALAAAHRDVSLWSRLLRIAVRAPMDTPIDLAHALAIRDAATRPIVAKLLNRYERAQGTSSPPAPPSPTPTADRPRARASGARAHHRKEPPT